MVDRSPLAASPRLALPRALRALRAPVHRCAWVRAQRRPAALRSGGRRERDMTLMVAGTP